MTEFIEQNLIALISLLIALFGGAPGTIAIVKYFREKSFFKFSLTSTVIGNLPNGKNLMLLLSGTISNSGGRALVPSYFNLEIKINDVWKKMTKTVIPKNAKFESDTQDINIKEPWEADLQKKQVVVTRDNAVYGHLMFFSNDLKKEDILKNNLEFKLICTDIHGKNYVSYFFSKLDFNAEGGVAYPKHGIEVQPK